MIRKLSHEEILIRQVTASRAPRVPVVVVLDSVRSLLNVGAIFRAADGAGIERLLLCGITGYPPQGGIAKTALGAEESVLWEYHQDAVRVVRDLKTKGYMVVALEQTEGAVGYDRFSSRGPVCLVVGNEVDGVSDGVMALCDAAVEIPMSGVKNSLNVSVAFGIAVFFLAASLRKSIDVTLSAG